VVGAERGAVRLYLHEERSTRHTLVGHEIGTGAPLADHVVVPAVPIAEVLVDGCDLLKIDCEGAEFEILAGASDEALRRARRVVVEFHRTVGDPNVLLERLAAAGFSADVLAEDEPFGVIGAVL
jgi:FkbM family methyltransferase